MSNSNDSGFTQGLVLGAFLGGAVGAITALMLAPKTGAEFRRELSERGQDLYDKSSDYLYNAESTIGDVVNSTVNEGRVKAQDIISSAKKQADEIISSAEGVLHVARSKAVDTKDLVTDKISDLKDASKASVEAFKKEMNSSEENEV